MVHKKISELPKASDINGDELIPFAKQAKNGAVDTQTISRLFFNKAWSIWGGTVADGQYIKFDTTMDYAKAMRIYGMHELIDKVVKAGCKFNAETELFSLNGIDDLTKEDMELIDLEWAYNQSGPPISRIVKSRTNYAMTQTSGAMGLYNFQAPNLEVFAIPGTIPTAFSGWLSDPHPKLKKILGIFNMAYFTNPSNVGNGLNCPNLSEIKFQNLKCDLNISGLASISLESLTYLVANAANTKVITVTVHTDVYTKLTGGSSAEWHKVLTDAAAKDISFATE